MHIFFVYTCFICVSIFIVNTHASYASISCTLAFLCKYFLSSIHMLIMHVFHVYLLFLQVFFIINTLLLMRVFHVHLLFCTSIFRRQYTCFLCMYFMCTCFFVQVFFVINTHASYACISCTLAFFVQVFLRVVIWTMITSF